jgi:hypothetical protein
MTTKVLWKDLHHAERDDYQSGQPCQLWKVLHLRTIAIAGSSQGT